IDISRLRESRIQTSGTGDLTIVREPEAPLAVGDGNARGSLGLEGRQPFPRWNVSLSAKENRARRKSLLALTGVIACLLAIGAVLFAFRRTAIAPPVPNVNAEAVPSPTLLPSTSPSPVITA